jgi:hypothetical protein
VPKTFSGYDDRVKIKLLHMFARFILDGLAGCRKGYQAGLHPSAVRRQKSPSVRGTNLEFWEAVKSPLENQVGKRNCRFERLADYVRLKSISFQPALRLRESLRMNEDECVHLLDPLPERIKLWSGEFFAVDAPADQAAAHMLLLYALF